jgi:hypothetical protein
MSARPPAQVLAPLSRVDRVAVRSLREGERRRRAGERRRASKADAEAYETLIARLTEAHHVVFKRIDWAKIEEDGPMAPTVPRDAVSSVARKKLSDYRPTLADSLLGRERERRRELTEKVVEAARADAELYGRAKAEADAHNRMLGLAAEVRALNPDAIAGVLKVNGAAKALKDVVEGFSLRAEGPARLVAQVDLIEFDALPDEACKAAVSGAAAWTELPPADRAQLQLANACSVALRAAVEVLQVAPVEIVEMVARLCRPGGLADTDFDPVLHVKVPAIALAKANLKKMEAPTIVSALSAALDWTAVRGLAPIELDAALAPKKAAA